MCSTPRSSGSVTKTRRLSTSSHIRSDLQMLHTASDMLEKKYLNPIFLLCYLKQ